VVACWLTPTLWTEEVPGGDSEHYRVPDPLNEDYWFFERRTGEVPEDQVAALGDSVVWGPHVASVETLPSHLSRRSVPVANLSLQGAHPAALAGLIEHFGGALRDRRIVLHLNLLWMSSPRHDLREDKEFAFNHPQLVPQFSPSIPCYRATASERLGNVVRRNVPFLQWGKHLQQAYFDHLDVPSWIVEHPDRDPLAALGGALPGPSSRPTEEPVSWTERGIRPQGFQWVDPETSLQWASFRRALSLLRQRGNRVFVLVGPFNEHLLTVEGRIGYQRVKDAAVTWLEREGVPFLAPRPLPSGMYADATHPLADGYKSLAETIAGSDPWRAFVGAP